MRKTCWVFASLLLLIAVELLVVFQATGKQEDSSQLESPRRTQVAQSQATYVGKSVCKECHQANHALHAQHGHASTFFRVEETDIAKQLDGKTFDAGSDIGEFHYQRENANLSVTLPSKFGDRAFPLQYLLGSGKHAQTIITLTTAADGSSQCIEHRASIFPGLKLATTPGQVNQVTSQDPLELFGQAVLGEQIDRCVYCHTTRADVQGEQVNNLVAHVNCEKCHGPGSLHVQSARKNPEKVDPFSVGEPTWDAESEIQLCGDCHRLPNNVTEKEVREYPDLLVRFQPIGLLRSKCYLDSAGEMRCTTCHNPHKSEEQVSEAEHIKNCVACHQEQSDVQVACPVSPEEACIECHMPSIKIGAGLEFHDHWIRVRKPANK